MKRLTAIGAVVLLVSMFAPAAAGGGGGCHGPVTDDATTKVRLEMACFSPTVARVAVGDTVTFKNVDPMLHAVGGVGDTFGGHMELKPDESASFEFNEEGTFPYVCIYHPGMAGAIVVGDGLGAGTAPAPISQVGPPSSGSEEAAAAAATESSPTPASDSNRAWLVGAGIVVGIILLFVAAVPRRRAATQL